MSVARHHSKGSLLKVPTFPARAKLEFPFLEIARAFVALDLLTAHRTAKDRYF